MKHKRQTKDVPISLTLKVLNFWKLVWFGLCCLMTPGLSKDIRCHVWPYFFWTCKSPDQTLGHTERGLSAWWLHMVTLIFLRGLCGYVWVNILTLSPQRVMMIQTSYCSLKPLWSGMGEVVPARTSPTLHPPFPPTVHQLSWLAL